MIRIKQVLAILSILFAINCDAQHLVGINGFGLMSTVSCDAPRMNKYCFTEPGYGFGIGYKHMELRNIIGFQGEINFHQTGFTIKDEAMEKDYTRNLKSLNIPVYMHIDFGQHAFKVLFAVGTYGNFLLDAGSVETDIEFNDSTNVNLGKIHNGKFRTFSYGLTGQAGFAVCTKAGVFQVTARGNIGMSKMEDLGDLSLFNYVSERTFGVGLSYYKPFGKGDPYYTKKEKIKNSEPLDNEKVIKSDADAGAETAEEQESDAPSEEEPKEKSDAPTEQDLNWEEHFDEK